MASISQILGCLILDAEGERLAVRYSSSGTKRFVDFKQQRAFEKKIIAKIPRNALSRGSEKDTHVDVAIIDEQLVLFRGISDVLVIIVADELENEMVLMQLVDGIFDSLITCCCSSIMSQGLSKRAVLEKLERAILILDEVQDDGIILEIEEDKICHRVKMHGDGTQEGPQGGIPTTNETVAQVAEKTRTNFLKSFFPGRS